MPTYTAGTKVTIESRNEDGSYRGLTTLTLTKEATVGADGTLTLTGWHRTGRHSEEVETITAAAHRVSKLV